MMPCSRISVAAARGVIRAESPRIHCSRAVCSLPWRVMPSWQIWALLSAGFAALTAIFAKIGVAHINPDVATFIRTIVILLVLGTIVAATGQYRALSEASGRTYAFLILWGLATGASWWCYFRSEGDRALAQKLQPLIASGRFDPPWVRELAAAVHEPEERVRQILRKQVTRGAVYQVVRDLFYDSERIAELANLAAALAREHGAVGAAQYRDAVGLGRKRAIQVLEFFDRIGYTRRVHDSHVLRKDSGWRARAPIPDPRKAHVPGGAAGLQTQEGASDASW
jgi:Elongation factor SelB, winged helix/EamA-like transporter family